jgi:hypothetical protein
VADVVVRIAAIDVGSGERCHGVEVRCIGIRGGISMEWEKE